MKRGFRRLFQQWSSAAKSGSQHEYVSSILSPALPRELPGSACLKILDFAAKNQFQVSLGVHGMRHDVEQLTKKYPSLRLSQYKELHRTVSSLLGMNSSMLSRQSSEVARVSSFAFLLRHSLLLHGCLYSSILLMNVFHFLLRSNVITSGYNVSK